MLNKTPTLLDVFLIQDLAKRMSAAFILVQVSGNKKKVDLSAFENAITTCKKAEKINITSATIRKVAEVDFLDELDEPKCNNLKLLFLAAGHQLLQKV